MNHITKPMLAGKCERPNDLSFPVLATPKLDGIRCLKLNGRALTRSFKPVSNRFTREWIEANLPDGLDGELIVRGTTFSETAGHIGRESGQPDFTFAVFDYVSDGVDVPYVCRMQELARLPRFEHFEKILPVTIHNVEQLTAYEEKCLADGYEGVMIRTPDSPYKCGRSTEREGWLLKIKRFEDAEAVVLETYESMSNHNEAQRDAFGRTKRSSAQAGKVGRAELGGFVVRLMGSDVVFRLGYNHVLGGMDRVILMVNTHTPFPAWQKEHASPFCARQLPQQKLTNTTLTMNDRETRRYNMFGRVQTFGKDNSTDFAAGSKATGHFAANTQVIKDLDIEKAKQGGGTATAKEVLLDALRLDLQNIARTARAIAEQEPGFADKYRLPGSPGQSALLTAADAFVLELDKAGIAAKFIAYELPADFLQDLKDDIAAIANADTDMESDDQEGVASTAAVGRLIKAGMAEVTQLDAILHNKYARNPDKLRAWQSASHIERAPKREKKPAGGTTPKPNP